MAPNFFSGFCYLFGIRKGRHCCQLLYTNLNSKIGEQFYRLACKQYFLKKYKYFKKLAPSQSFLTDSGKTGSTRAAMDQSEQIYPIKAHCLGYVCGPSIIRTPEIIPKSEQNPEKLVPLGSTPPMFKH
jgi:hypothetical protein